MPSQHLITRIWRHPRVTGLRHFISPPHWYRFATASQRRLPDYIIVGAQKAGTSSMHKYLALHPQILVSSNKEVHYFDQHYDRGVHWYQRHFPIATPRTSRHVCGESTPMYMFCPHSPRRIAGLLPHVKLIVLLRNPINRAFSHYHQIKRLGMEPLTFEAALAAETSRTAGDRARLLADEHYPAWDYRWYSYAQRGIYVDQLLELRKHFPRENMLIMQSERYFSDTTAVLDRVAEFLGVDHWAWKLPQRSNRNRPKMDAQTRQHLKAFFAPHNERLFAELGERFIWD